MNNLSAINNSTNIVLYLTGCRSGLAKMMVYVVDRNPSMIDELTKGISAANVNQPLLEAALTLIGVKSLFTPEMLIEIEAVAIIE